MSTYFNSARGRWVYNFIRAGERHSGYCVNEDGTPSTTKRQADACEARIKREVEKALKTSGAASGVRVAGCFAVEQMFADYVSQSAGAKRSFQTNIKRYVAELLDFLGRQTAATSITNDTVEAFIVHSRAQLRGVYSGGPKKGGDYKVTDGARTRSDSTTNRYLACLRAAINWASKRGKMPPLHVRHLEEPAELPTPISPQLVMAIWAKAPPHLRLAITIAVHTGMRLDETLGLRWDWIDLDARTITLPSKSTKSKAGQVVFVNDDLAAALIAAPRVCDVVVTYTRAVKKEALERRPPKPIKSLKRAWQTAQKAAGIAKPYRFHDLRATFCTAVLAANHNPMALKNAARHASLATTMRYAKLADESVRQAFNATAGLLKSQTKVTNAKKKPRTRKRAETAESGGNAGA
ncbi:MAG TPA: site-specific integrase [Magnetospirillum sp.]|nr:site-specific integrase [Magnetospirillum sp.]